MQDSFTRSQRGWDNDTRVDEFDDFTDTVDQPLPDFKSSIDRYA